MLFIVIPAYNEARSIAQVIEEVKKEIPEAKIVVVDDGSTDNTSSLASQHGAIVLRHVVNRGQGAALQTGDEYALDKGAEIVVHFDADGQHQAEDIKKMIEPIRKGEADIVLGSRFLEKTNKVPLTKKFFILKPAIIFNWFFCGLKLTDAHNGWRALSRRALQKISITQDGMAHNTEIIEQIRKKGLKYKEVPVRIVYHEYGQSWGGGVKILRDLFWRKIF